MGRSEKMKAGTDTKALYKNDTVVLGNRRLYVYTQEKVNMYSFLALAGSGQRKEEKKL